MDTVYFSRLIALPYELKRSPSNESLMFHLAAICLCGPLNIPWQVILKWKMEVLHIQTCEEYGTTWETRVLVNIWNDANKPYVICIYLGMNITFDSCFPRRFRGYKPYNTGPECLFTLSGQIRHADYGSNYVQLIDWSARKFPPEYLKEMGVNG